MNKKARGDAKLKTLPAERQASIAEHGAAHTLAETLAWLREDGLATSSGALSEFLSWWRLGQQLERNQAAVERLLLEVPASSAEEMQKLGQAFFSALAIEQQDAKVWAFTQNLELKRGELELARQKFRRETAELFLKWQADQRAREIASSSSTNAEKIERLGELMFGEDWE